MKQGKNARNVSSKSARLSQAKDDYYTVSTAARMLGVASLTVRALISLNFLEHREDKVPWVRLPKGTTLERLRDLHFAKAPEIDTLEGFEWFKQCSKLLQTKERRIPDAIVDAAFRYMQREGLAVTLPRVSGLVGGPRPLGREIYLREIEKRGLTGTRMNARRFRWSGRQDEEPLLLARLGPAARTAPSTYLDPNAGSYFPKPPPLYFARLNDIRCQPLLEITAIVVFFAHARGVSAPNLKDLMAAMTNIDLALQGEDLRKPLEVRALLDRILGPEWQHTQRIGYPRPNIVRRYDWLLTKFDEFLDEAVLAGRGEEFESLRLSKAAGHATLMGAVKASLAATHAEGAENRNARIQKILDHPETFQLVGRTRLEEHQAILRKIDQRIDRILKSGRPLTKPVRFQVTYETRLEGEQLRKFKQRLHLEIWTWEMLVPVIRNEMAQTAISGRVFSRGVAVPTEGRAAFAVRFVGISPEQPGGPTQTPVVVEVARSHLLDRTATLSARHTKQREEAIERLGFDLANWRTAAGLPAFAAMENAVAREAVRHLDWILLPIRELTLGMTIANAAVEVMLDSGCRWFEASQTKTEPVQWEDHYDDKIEQTIWTFKAVPKLKHENAEFHILDATMSRLMGLAEALSEAWHEGGPIPATRGTVDLRARGMKPARYIFHVRQAELPHDLLSMLFRLLYLGWFGLKGHDVRHLFNNIAREAKVPQVERMQMMGHQQAATNENYGRQTPLQARRERARHHRFLLQRGAKLAKAVDAPVSVEVARIEKQIRLQQTLMEFYLSEGDLDEAEAAEAEMTSLAARLAKAHAVASGADRVIDVDAI